MTEDTTDFTEELLALRPDVAEEDRKHRRKGRIARQLRSLRDARGLTQAEIAAASGLKQSVVSRLESLTGPVPKWQSIERYVAACEGYMALIISADPIDAAEIERHVRETDGDQALVISEDADANGDLETAM